VGPLPAPQPPEPRTDGFCARWPSGEGPLVVNREGRVANVVVRVVSGWTGPPVLPAQPAHFEQRGCRYHPRVLVAQVGQVVTVANHDEIGHQVRALQGDTPLLSHRQPFRAPEVGWRAERVGQIVRFGCDDHPGMVGHVVVADSPWWAITDPEGRFQLAGLPAGTYRLEAWHERLGVRQAEVTVPSAAARAVSFEFGEPEPRAPSWDLCAIAVEGSSPVVEACRREGRKGAKKLMKAMVAVARKAGRRLQCDGCHRGDEDYVLRADARRRFAELVALTGSTGGPR
jgi:plastocyanin